MPTPVQPANPVSAAIERYFANVAERLATLTPSESRDFLAAQVERWLKNQQRFVDIIDADKPMPAEFDGATIWDFHATLARLSALQAEFKVAA